jgi:homoserine O-succinyltransferase
MPDPAFVETERQFLQLLRAAAKSVALQVRLFSLPGIARGREIETRINTDYFAMEDLYRQPPTALIVTGTEPILRDITSEPYFAELAKLLEWSAGSTCSVILSCLAAHAAALVFDGIARVRLPTKCAGVFDHSLPQPTHRLLGGLAGELRTPHSRINGIPVRRLTESKYLVLATSTAAGWNLAVKEHGESLFLLFQGHPEYSTSSLLREYRRDARRYLLRQSESYPALPANYLSAPSERLLRDYERAARSARGTDLGVGEFPFSAVETSLRNSWESDSTVLYQNWIEMVVERAAGQSGLGQATQLAGAYRESRR